MLSDPCPKCGSTVIQTGVGRRRIYCSKLCQRGRNSGPPRNERQYRPCTDCGKPMGVTRSTAAAPTCQPCRRVRPGYRSQRDKRIPSGTVERWTCGRCGVDCARPAARGTRPKWCPDCRRKHNGKDFSKALRLSVYERDGWVCGICLDPVDAALTGTGSEWRASLDHIVPASQGGSDEAENLRLAHFWCNCIRADGRFTDEDFRRGRTDAA